MISGLGANHFGYGNMKIREAVNAVLPMGGCHSLPTIYEVEAAEKLKEVFTFVERVKWVNDGSSACTAACIMARQYTSRSRILTEGYHGWHAEQISPVAIKPDGNTYNIKKMINLNEIDKTIAAVILEPMQLDNSRERVEWLKKLRQKCTEHNVVLIFDEVITGLRYNSYGVCNDTSITRELLLLGKAIGNGEKIAAVCGPADILDSAYFVSGTYHGHVPSLVAAKTCLHLAKFDQQYDVKKLNADSLDFYEKFNDYAKGMISLKGLGSRGAFDGQVPIYMQEMAKLRILIGPSFFVNFSSVKALPELLRYSKMVLEKMHAGTVKLEGTAPSSAIAAKARQS
jgi:glutamate-1-semialdehyde aminotransferase